MTTLNPWTHDSPFVPGTTVRADAANSKFDGIATSLAQIADKVDTKVPGLPNTFSGNAQIPEKTVLNTLLWINTAGNMDLYPKAQFDADVLSAANNAAAAALSKAAAESSAASAAISASNANSSAVASAASASTASGAADTATTKATQAATSATNAATSATNAASSASAAGSSASSASASASTANTKASEALTSANNASVSATNAANSASSAFTSAGTATTGASTATTKAGEATTAATMAQKWASETVDIVVASGKYSSLHYATKAEYWAGIAEAIGSGGNAATASKLLSSRTIAATGDINWTVSFDGSGNVTAAATLSNVVAAGTGTKVTFNAKGQVTGSAALASTDIPNLDAAKVTTGRFAYSRLPAAASGVLKAQGDSSDPAFAALIESDIPNLNASKLTAGTLAAARLPAFSGDLTSSAGSASLTLTDTGVVAGVHAKVTVDAKGRVTAGAVLAAADIPVLDATKITTGTLPVARGGSGAATLSGMLKGNGTSAFSTAVAGTDFMAPGSTVFIGTTSFALNRVSAAMALAGVSIDGNAGTATKLATSRTITLAGDISGSAAFDGSANISITATVADDSHNHIISNVDGLQTVLDAKAPLASPALTGTPTAPTAAVSTNTTQLASTAFVQSVVKGYLEKSSLTGGTITLTADEATNAVLAFTGALTSNLIVQLPAGSDRVWVVLNSTTGAFSVTLRRGTTGSTVAVAQGKRNIVFMNASGMFDAFNDFDAIALTGISTATTAAVGTNTTQIATTAFVNAEIANDAPTKTGGGASGTWGINITGSAAEWTTARTVSLTGGVTGSASVDGSANVSIATTLANFDAAKIISGTVAAARLPFGTANNGFTVSTAAPSGGTDGQIWMQY